MTRGRVAGLVTGAVLLLSVVLRAPDATQLLQFTILGIAAGAVYAIAASGVVLTYATTGVFNFAHGGLGMISAFVYWQLRVEADVPAPLAALLVLGVLGPALGYVLERMFRGLRDADVGTAIVLTIAVTVLFIGIAQYAFEPDEAHNLGPIISGTVKVLGATITWDDVLQIGVAAAIALGLRALLFRTRAGTTMRAVVDDPGLAALNGASSTAVARGSWILGTELAMVAGILIGSGSNLEAITLTFFVVNAYGAAVLGRLRSLPLTFAGAIALGLVQSWGSAFWFPKAESGFALADGEHWRRVALSLPGIFLFVALLFLPQARLAVGRRVRRPRPRVPGPRAAAVRAGLFVAVVAGAAQVLPEEDLGDATRALVFGVILLSLVVLTGLSGQVSLAQYVFVAVGAWAMGSALGGSSPFGLLVAAVAPLPIALLVALPAMRLQGLYLALVTFGFASVSRDLVIQDRAFYGGGPVEVGRPTVLGVDFAGDRAFLVLCGVVFALVALGVLALRRGAWGRRLAAVRDSEAACATLGLDPRGTKLLAFCLSAGIAGIGGALFGGSQLTVSDIPFEPINNIVLFLFAVVGGVTTVSGALVGGALFALLPYVQSHHPGLAGLVFAGIAAVAIGLGRHPDGLVGMATSWFDARRGRWAWTGSRRWVGAVAAVAVLVIGIGVGAPVAGAQTADGPFAAFGGFEAVARAGGLQVSYDVQGVLPLPPPLVQVTVPNAVTRAATGPATRAFGSVAYPGDLVGNLPSLVEQSAPGTGGLVPPYPVATVAEFPTGPSAARQDIGTASATVEASVEGAHASTSLAGSSVPGVVEVGAVTTTTRSGVEDGRVVARSRTHVASASLLFGLVRVEDVVTDVVAATDGTTARTDGTTTVGSVSILGLPATLGPDGLVLGAQELPTGAGPLQPLVDALGGLADPVDQLGAAAAPLSDLLADVLGSSTASLDDLLAVAGLHLEVGPLHEELDGARAAITGSGLHLGLDLDGSGDGPLAQLLALIPSDDLPGAALPGVPVNTSPQALVNLLKERHVADVDLAPGRAGVDATAAFAPGPRGSAEPSPGGSGPRGGSVPAGSGFTTPLPELISSRDPSAPTTRGGGGGLVGGRATELALVLLALLTLPAWAVGSTRLMDAALAEDAPGCAVDPVPPNPAGGPRGPRGP